MSDNIPLELQAEIIKWVPVKPLLKFRSVSKQWKSLIDSPEFGAVYCISQSQPRLIVRYIPFEKDEEIITSIHNGSVNYLSRYKFVSIADDDDDTFQQHQIPSTTLPNSVNNLMDSVIVGCSHGLFCFYGCDYRDGSYTVVFWNPWIRKCVDIPVPNLLFKGYEIIIGFGVSPQTKDPKIVKINNVLGAEIDTSVCIPWRVEVFTLSSRTWKSPSGSRNNLPCRNSIIFGRSHVALDGVIYWMASEMIHVGDRFENHNLIMSFDLSIEGFEEICLPDNLARLDKCFLLSISKRLESVVVLEKDETQTSFGVWMMGQGVTKSFAKLFNIIVTTQEPHYFKVCGFMRNGDPIIDHGSGALFGYDTCSKPHKDLGIVGFTFSVQSYMGTLLLIDQ